MTAFKFGHFEYICERAALTICPLMGTGLGVMPTCYSRNVQLGSQVIFQPGESYSISIYLRAVSLSKLRCRRSSGRLDVARRCIMADLVCSNMFRPHRRPWYDNHHALPRSIQVHRRREKGDRPILLHVHVCRTARNLPRLGHHSYCPCSISGESEYRPPMPQC